MTAVELHDRQRSCHLATGFDGLIKVAFLALDILIAEAFDGLTDFVEQFVEQRTGPLQGLVADASAAHVSSPAGLLYSWQRMRH